MSLMQALVDASVATVRRSSYHFLPMTRGNPQAEPPITVDYPRLQVHLPHATQGRSLNRLVAIRRS